MSDKLAGVIQPNRSGQPVPPPSAGSVTKEDHAQSVCDGLTHAFPLNNLTSRWDYYIYFIDMETTMVLINS